MAPVKFWQESQVEEAEKKTIELIDVEVTTEQVTEYLNAMTTVHSCPSCTKNEWVILIDSAFEFGLTSMRRDRGTAPPVIIPAIPMVCGNCGYIKSYAKRSIVNWLDSRDAK